MATDGSDISNWTHSSEEAFSLSPSTDTRAQARLAFSRLVLSRKCAGLLIYIQPAWTAYSLAQGRNINLWLWIFGLIYYRSVWAWESWRARLQALFLPCVCACARARARAHTHTHEASNGYTRLYDPCHSHIVHRLGIDFFGWYRIVY